MNSTLKNIWEWVKDRTDTKLELAVIYIAHVLTSSVAFSFIEDKNFGDAVWWAFGSGLGIGYGDVYPNTTAGRILTVWLVMITLFLAVRFISSVVFTKLQAKFDQVITLLEEIKANKK